MRELTPYDTGERLEPKPWIGNREFNDGDDDYGKVDFENDESATQMTIHVERTSTGYNVVIESFGDAPTVTIL